MTDTRCTVENVIGFGTCTRTAKWLTSRGEPICGTHAAQRFTQRHYEPGEGWVKSDWHAKVTPLVTEEVTTRG